MAAGTGTPAFWTPIDWTRSWLAPMRRIGQLVEQAVMQGTPLCDALNHAGPCPVRFVPQAQLPATMAYEQFIAETGNCPTRDSLHDFYNGLCWLHFPATKRRLNQLQSAQIATRGVQPVRGAVRDALTVFDENAAFLNAPQPLWEALQAKCWPDVFGRLRPQWQDAHLLLFGHALLEKLHAPRKAITAHVYRLGMPGNLAAEVDAWVAHDLSAEKLASKPFAHLPVLGVPTWWAANEAPGYYRDDAVFRPPRPTSGVVQ